jgi:predicted PurR-regulated permease PerM
VEARKPNPEVQRSQVTLKTVFTVCFGVLGVLALVEALVNSLVALTLTCAAVLLAVALDHGVQFLVRRRMNRQLAIAVITVGMLGVIVGLAFTLIPPAIEQGKELIQQAPGLLRSARGSRLFARLDNYFHLAHRIKEFEDRLPELIEGSATPILTAVGGVLSFIAATVTVFFLTVFMLIFGGRLVRNMLAEARAERRQLYETVLTKIYRSIGGYLGGLMLICTINGTLTTIFLAFNRVPFFLPLGILSGASSTVPYAGPFVMGTVTTLLSLATGGGWHGLASAIYFIAYGQVEGNILSPLIFRRTVHVNPLVVTVSVLFLGEIAGIIGAVIAVPVVAALQIVLREVLRVRREQIELQRAARHASGERT